MQQLFFISLHFLNKDTYVEIKCIILLILKLDGFACSLVYAERFTLWKRPIVPYEQSTTLLGGRSLDRFQVLSLGKFSVATDRTMCPGVDSSSKNEYQRFLLGQRRPVRKADNLPPSQYRTSRKSGALTYPEPLGPPRPVVGDLYLLPLCVLQSGLPDSVHGDLPA